MTVTTMFLLIVIILLYIGYFFILPVLSASNYRDSESQDALNTELYKSKLAELHADLSAGTLDESELKNAETELKLQLLSEADVNPDKVFTAPEALRYRMVLLLVLAIPAVAGLMYAWIGHPKAFQQAQRTGNPHSLASKPRNTAKPTKNTSKQPAPMTIPQASAASIVTMEEKLKANPKDINTLFALAITYQRRREFVKSAAKYKKILEIYPKTQHRGKSFATFMASYADVLASSQKGSLEGEPKKILFRALAAYPQHRMSLHLAGTYYFRKGDYKGAIKFWTKLHKLLASKPAYASRIMASINDAKAKLAGKDGTSPAISTTPTVTATAPKSATPTASTGTFAITGTITIDPALKFTPNVGNFLFISVKRPSGPPRPIAALKLNGISYPYKFSLSDKNQLIPTGNSLKDMLPLVLTARITKSGNVMDRTGSVVGSVTVSPGASDKVLIIINKQ